MELAAHPFPEAPEIKGDVPRDLYVLSLFADAIKLMDEHAADSWIGHLGLDQTDQASREMRRTFIRLFRTGLLHPLDKELNSIFAKMTPDQRNRHISEYISYAVWRVNMIQRQVAGKETDSLPAPPDQALALALGGRMPEISPLFKDVYRDYLAWSGEAHVLKAEAEELRIWLAKLIATEGVELHWLASWADSRPGVQPVTLGEFWIGPSGGGEKTVVEGAFTPDGYKAIDTFLEQIRSAVQSPDDFARREAQFRKWYASQYYQAWQHFTEQFARGEDRLLTPEDWQAQAAEMATLDNPYFTLLERIDSAFKPISDTLDPPPLGRLASEFVVIRNAVASKAETATLADKLTEKVQTDAEKTVGKFDPKAMRQVQAKLDAVKALQSYLDALQQFLPPTATMESGYKFARALYGAEGGKGGQGGANPLEAAEGALRSLQGQVDKRKFDPGGDAKTFWNAMRGPVVFMISYIANEASCQVQALWEGEVLSRVQETPESELRKKLFGKNGLAGKFSSGPADPFLTRTRNGWAAKRLMGVSFPFKPEFLNFLQVASRNVDQIKDQYTVTIKALPTDVNKEAKVDPYSTELRLDCEGGVQSLTNFNYPVSKDFVWKPDKCGDAALFINFPNLQLSETWQGRDGLQKFLRDFSDGAKAFEPSDFPKDKDMLESLGIKKIIVSYDMKGAEPVRNLLEQKPPVPPENISWCWYRNY
jgi:type VI secretion system protein ImpL